MNSVVKDAFFTWQQYNATYNTDTQHLYVYSNHDKILGPDESVDYSHSLDN